MPATPEEASDHHEWVSFDLDGYTWCFDLTFLTSDWSCIYLDGCPGVLDHPAPELVHGCCTHGAHFADKADRKAVVARAAALDETRWPLRAEADRLGGPAHKNEDGEWVTRLVDGACIFLNRVGAPTGPGCALHQAAVAAGERPMDWKPTVCWQLPLRLDESTDVGGHVTYTLREWKRRDWGPGGDDFHWWCTESPEAFGGGVPVWQVLADEIVELVGQRPFEHFASYVGRRGRVVFLTHPALSKGDAPG